MWHVLVPNPFCLPALLPEGMSEVSKPGNWLLFILFIFVKEEQQSPGSDSKES